MARIYQVLELCYPNGIGQGVYRMTVRSDEESWPPRGLCAHRHRSAETARECRAVKRELRRIFGFRRRRPPGAELTSGRMSP